MRAFDAQPAHADAQRADLLRRLARVVLALQNYFVDREDCPQGGPQGLLVQVGARGRAPARAAPDLDAHKASQCREAAAAAKTAALSANMRADTCPARPRRSGSRSARTRARRSS